MDILQGIKRLKNSLSNEKDPDIILTTKAIMVGMTNFYFKNKKDEALEKFQKAYKEWFEKITKANTGQVSQDDIDIILKKDKLRKQVMDACSAAKSSK